MKLFNRIWLLLAALSVFTACERDYDGPPIEEPTYVVDADANFITIDDIRQLGASLGSTDVYNFTGEKDVLQAVITGTDITGNIYKKIYVQDETGNIEIEIDQSGIYKDFQEGQEIFLDLKGLCIAVYGGELQIGDPNGTNKRIGYDDFKARAHKNGWAKASNINTKIVTDFSTLQDADRFALVTVENVKFEAGGKSTFAEADKTTNVNLIDSKGNTLILRNSNYADFAKKLLPTGTGNITGILGRFNGTWQLTIRSLDDLVGFDPIEDPQGNTGDTQNGITFKKVTTITSGKKYIIAANDNGVYKVAQNLAASKTYGWLNVDNATATEGVIGMSDESHVYVFVANGNNWYIKDQSGRYMFMAGTYNSFNVGTEASNDAVWSVSANADGTMKITNTSMNKYIQYSVANTSYGAYPDEKGIMPELFEMQGEGSDSGETGTGGGGTSGVIYSETFETSQGGFTIEDVTKPAELEKVWAYDSKYKCMKATAYVSSTQTRYETESMTVSPVIDLTSVSSATLKFEHCGRYFDGKISEMCTVWVKVEGGAWEQLTDLQYNDETGFTFTANTVDLAKYCGKKIQVGFKYTSTSTTAGTYEVRNVSVE